MTILAETLFPSLFACGKHYQKPIFLNKMIIFCVYSWSKFVADMNSFEWLRNPLSSSTKKKRIAEQLKETAEGLF